MAKRLATPKFATSPSMANGREATRDCYSDLEGARITKNNANDSSEGHHIQTEIEIFLTTGVEAIFNQHSSFVEIYRHFQ